MQISYRVIQADEHEFLNEMLYEALFVPPGQPKFPREIIEDPSIKKYTENWNQQEDDLALVCLNGDELIGAIWGRKFSNDNSNSLMSQRVNNGNTDGANSFLTCKNDGAMTFLNG